MSLKLRIDILFGLLLFLGLAADIGRMALDARSRVQAENDGMTRITRDFVSASLANLPAGADAEARLSQLARSLGELRHVRILFARDSAAAASALLAPDASRLTAPRWFYYLVATRVQVAVLPAILDGKRFGDFLIAGDPADEVNEVWQDVRTLALIGGLVAFAALLGASWILARTLRPLDDYGRALGRLKDGDYAVRAEPQGSPEFVALCEKLNGLALALSNLSTSNRDLFQRLMTAQEQERKTIAHELHDEIGPHLFALRAHASLMRAALAGAGNDGLEARATAICAQVEDLQQHNRRILRRLRPPALDDLGLGPALQSLIDGWRETEPEVRVELELPQNFTLSDPNVSLVLYRFAQEALTNVFRHAGAKNASIRLSDDEASGEIRLRVADDGVGFAPENPVGLGLEGMRERVRGLGGRVDFGPAPGGGGLVEAHVPYRQKANNGAGA